MTIANAFGQEEKILLRSFWCIPGLGAWQPTPVFLAKESHGQRSLANYSPRSLKELDRTEQLILSLCAESHSQKAAAGFSGFFVLS